MHQEQKSVTIIADPMAASSEVIFSLKEVPSIVILQPNLFSH